jgi:hypothetical protein
MTKADKGQFDEVLRRMLQKPPQKTSEIKAPKTSQPTLSEAREMQEAEVEMYRKLQREEQSATSTEKMKIRSDMEIVLASISRWDTVIQELIKAR